jgi:hypothetical protein
MLPCSTATRAGTPSAVSEEAASRDAPQAVDAATSTAVQAITAPLVRSRWTMTSAAAAAVKARRPDSPYTPTTLAIWTIGSQVTWL